jgi:hypothetical protein
MKLIVCKKCWDVVSLRQGTMRECACGQSKGQYIDELYADIFGPCVPIGFHNTSFLSAMSAQPDFGPGKVFTSFIIEKHCPTIKHEEKKK